MGKENKGILNKIKWKCIGALIVVLTIYMYFFAGSVIIQGDSKNTLKNEVVIEMRQVLKTGVKEAYPICVYNDIQSYVLYTKLINELFPIIRYSDNYGIEGDIYAANEIPREFYESEDTVDVATKKALEEEPKEVISNNVTVATGTEYTMEQLGDFNFIKDNFYVIDSTTSLLPEEMSVDKLAEDVSVNLSSEDYKVLIYHTHGSEAFVDSRLGVTEDTIIGVGDELTRVLEEKYNIKVYHDRNVYDMVNGTLDRSYAYNLSREGVKKILAENPSIEVAIDLHRDGVAESTRLVTELEGKPTARIMLLNGVSRLNTKGDIEYLHNPYRQTNLAFSFQMYVEGKKLYGDYLRKMYIRGYRYNLDLLPRTALIEVGAQNNTLEEEKNAMDPLATIIFKVLSGEP